MGFPKNKKIELRFQKHKKFAQNLVLLFLDRAVKVYYNSKSTCMFAVKNYKMISTKKYIFKIFRWTKIYNIWYFKHRIFISCGIGVKVRYG